MAEADTSVAERILGEICEMNDTNLSIYEIAVSAKLNPLDDFVGLSLRGIDLSGEDLRGFNLSRGDFCGSIFTGCDLSGCNLSHADFTDADFTAAILHDVLVDGANFRNANFANAELVNIDLRNAFVHGARFVGASFSNVIWARRANEYLTRWLQDTHGMEKQAIASIVSQQDSLQNYAELHNWAQDEVRVSKLHRELIGRCLKRRGVSASAGKHSALVDISMRVMAEINDSAGTPGSGQLLVDLMGIYALKHYKIAWYMSLIAAAEVTNDHETKSVCERIVVANKQRADRLDHHIARLTREYLRMDTPTQASKRA